MSFKKSAVMTIYRYILLGLVMAASNAANSDTVSQRLSALLQPIETLSASFSQQLFDADGTLIESAEGVFKLAKPGKMLWHIIEPMEQKLVSDGTVLWIYDPDLEQVVIESFTDKIKTTPITLLTGDVTDLDERYTIALKETAKDTVLFTLTPSNSSSLFSHIAIEFMGSTPQSIVIMDTFDQRTVIEFGELSVNPILDDAIFSFVIPNQVDVINNVR